MRKIIPMACVFALLLAPFTWPQAIRTQLGPRGPSVATGSQGVVVSGKPAATAAGIRILQQGGNAADAGAATLLALSVTYVGAFCVGGEVPILIYSADQKKVKLLEGIGEAPRDPKAIAWYMQHGIPDGDIKAVAVPSTIDAVVTLLKLYGTKSFEEVVQPTLAILDAGGPSWYIDTGSGERIETGVNWQPDLAATFRKSVESEKSAKGTLWALKVNRFAARTIQVEPNQEVISSGPYSIVRHPMYLGGSVMLLFTPLALGSYFALPAFALLIPVILLRLLNEEKVLRQELPGYAEYCLRTRFRLVPLFW
jgi:Gamma-glutamyltranspeptidase/Phospholipid methyltransferase